MFQVEACLVLRILLLRLPLRPKWQIRTGTAGIVLLSREGFKHLSMFLASGGEVKPAGAISLAAFNSA